MLVPCHSHFQHEIARPENHFHFHPLFRTVKTLEAQGDDKDDTLDWQALFEAVGEEIEVLVVGRSQL